MQAQRPSIARLVSQIPQVAGDGNGIGRQEEQLAEAIQQHGAAAIALLLPYLQHPRPGVREFTGYILRDCPGLNPAHLPALMGVMKRGNVWISPAIARIGTPQAVTFLVEQLQHGEHDQDQLCFAIELLGVKAVPALCHLLRTVPTTREKLLNTIASLFADFDAEAKKVSITPLFKIARDENVRLPNRQAALQAFGLLGVHDAAYVPLLKLIAQRTPSLQEDTDEVIVRLGTPDAVTVLLRKLQGSSTNYHRFILDDIARLGVSGHNAGPSIVQFLESSNWETRVAAARALGFIGYRDAIPALIALLSDKEDWRRVYVASESLGRLHAEKARSALQQVAAKFWYPPVRITAQEAIAHIKSSKPYPPLRNEYPFDYFRLLYSAKSVSKPEQKKIARSDLAVSDGVLVATDNGEWGGNLTFVPTNGTAKQTLLDKNVDSIVQFNVSGPIIAIGGLAHMSQDYGFLYLVQRDSAGIWSAKQWQALPGAPRWATLIPPGGSSSKELLRVNCTNGTMDIAAEGTIKFIETARY